MRQVDGARSPLAHGGTRVLGVAQAALPPDLAPPETPKGLPFRFLGLVGLVDPLRPSVPAAVREYRSAGIRIVMITGDYPQTARAIAEQAGLHRTDIGSRPEPA